MCAHRSAQLCWFVRFFRRLAQARARRFEAIESGGRRTHSARYRHWRRCCSLGAAGRQLGAADARRARLAVAHRLDL